ncbi:hypothetical protein C1H46_002064 [Malus baccata]|uniref:Uncharacterized protein n=1 Tax=Malus baccata TaxID=106549 RepID=A0A540NN18_MALBA|nr:hypothetical protein C1H46_002064 [Malus baccata]
MSEFSFQPNTSKKIKISSLLLADLFNLCFCILSHPLYFSYFIFFSPYLLKLLSFLSPLFITTALLVVAYLTVQHDVADSKSSKVKLGCLVTAYQTVLEGLHKFRVDDSDGGDGDHDHEEFRSSVELEAYRIVFDTSTFEINETPAEKNCSQLFEAQVEDVSSHEANCASDVSDAASDVFDDKFEIPAEAFVEEEEENWPENLCKKEEEEEVINPPPSTESKKVEEQEGKEKRFMRRGESKDYLGDGGELNSKLSRVNSQTLGANLWESRLNPQTLGANVGECYYNMSPNLGSFGSMRKEKEWRRTLACKLFEERHQNVDGGGEGGGEGMDMLWETYDETESLKVVKGKKSKSKKGKDGKAESNEGEEEEFDGQLCCLQALKFSAGKMNLGMGRPNLVKFSKALKGFGWLHHVTKHGKKGHH